MTDMTCGPCRRAFSVGEFFDHDCKPEPAPPSDASPKRASTSRPKDDVVTQSEAWPGLGEEWRPWCCPEPRCTPVHTLAGGDKPLSIAEPGESFFCFGAAPTVEFVYDGVRHANDTRSCAYTALKGVISYQENADDWRAIAGAYSRATAALLRHRNGDQGVRNDETRATGGAS